MFDQLLTTAYNEVNNWNMTVYLTDQEWLEYYEMCLRSLTRRLVLL